MTGVQDTEVPMEKLNEKTQNAIHKVIKEKKIVDPVIRVTVGSQKGDGFMSDIYRVEVVPKGSKSEDDKLKLVVKVQKVPPVEGIVFERELRVYNEFLPEIKNLQKEHNVAEKEGFYHFPTFYHGEYDKATGDAVLVLEDFSKDKYTLGDRYTTLSKEQASKVITSLGRLHAISIVMKEKKPDVFDKFKDMTDIRNIILFNPAMQEMWNTVFRIAQRSLPDSEVEAKNKLTSLRRDVERDFKEIMLSNVEPNRGVIIHGDSKINNFLFTNDTNDVGFIDWQMTHYSHPIADLSQLMYTSLDKTARSTDLDNLLQQYIDAYNGLLEKCRISGDKHITIEIVKKGLKQFGKYGVILAICVIPAQAVPPVDQRDNIDDMLKAMERLEGTNLERIRDVILDAVRLEYL